jgi:uncharacterized protein YbaP (TraB family)
MSRGRSSHLPTTLLLAVLVAGWQSAGCATTSGADRADAATVVAQGPAPIFLWEVAPREGRPGRAFLYGSVHLQPKVRPPVDLAVTRTFDASTDLVFEADPSPGAQAAIQGLVQKLAMYPGNDRLEAHLGAELYEQTKLVASQLGLPAVAIAKMRPWLVSIMLEVYVASKLGFAQEMGTEQWALGRARGTKAIHELEGAEAQIQMFASMPESAQIDQLQYSVEHIGELPGKLRAIISLYDEGDASGLEALTFGEAHENPSGDVLLERFFYARNAQMAERIDALLAEEKIYFVVVGAGHLLGPKSVQDRLIEKGYSLVRVPPGGRPEGEVREAGSGYDNSYFSVEKAAEIQAEVGRLLAAGDYGEATQTAFRAAHQIRDPDKVVEGFEDAQLVQVLEPACEPSEWLLQWTNAHRCWGTVLEARQRLPDTTSEQMGRAAWGAALAATQLGNHQDVERLAKIGAAAYGPKPSLEPLAMARLLSVKAQLTVGTHTAMAHRTAQQAITLMADLYPPEHPAWRSPLMTLTAAAYWLGKSAELGPVSNRLVMNLRTGKPELPAIRDVFTLQRAGIRAKIGDKKGAREDLEASIAGMRKTYEATHATLLQYLQGAAKTYIRIGDKRLAGALLEETGRQIEQAGDGLGVMGPVLVADQRELGGRLLVARGKKKAGIKAMRDGLAYAREHLADRPAAVGLLECRLAQTLDELKRGRKEAKKLRAKGLSDIGQGFPAEHPVHEHCKKGTLPW